MGIKLVRWNDFDDRLYKEDFRSQKVQSKFLSHCSTALVSIKCKKLTKCQARHINLCPSPSAVCSFACLHFLILIPIRSLSLPSPSVIFTKNQVGPFINSFRELQSILSLSRLSQSTERKRSTYTHSH